MHYSGMTGPLVFKNNISWGHNFNYSVKQGNQQERLENCVGLGFIRISTNKMTHNLIGGGNEYDRRSNAPDDTILFVRERNLDKDFEFADPLNLDFRLQPDSRFRGTAPDGSDRGPYQYKKNIFYLSPVGDDGADGLSMRKPWRTLSRAFRSLKPGDTLYLAKGEYAAATLNKAGDGKSLIMIRGRGRDTVVVRGKFTVTGGSGIAFERLNFSDSVAMNDSRDLTLKNCTFFGRDAGLMAHRVAGLKVEHCVFAGVPLNIKSSNGVFLSGNIYANAGKYAVELDAAGAILYSDYNSYQDKAQCWKVKNAKWPFASLQKQHDRYSRTLKPKFVVIDDVPRLEDDNQFTSTGPHSTALGIYHEYDAAPKALDLVGPFLHSVSDTTANIEWWLSQPATCSLVWGKTPEMKNAVGNFRGLGRFNTFTLTGLKPGRTYHFKIVSVDASGTDAGPAALKPENATLTFKTAAELADPRVYYVAPEGSDDSDGLSRERAFRTICCAADHVGPGDTVLIAAGNYPENVRIRAAGTPERPITFRCLTGERANMLAGNLPRSFEVILKPDNRFDGLYFREQEFWREGFVVRQSPRVHITRCLNTMVDAGESPGMLLRNCVLHGGWNSVTLRRCPNSLVENNVFIMTILRQLVCNSPARVRRNVFCECVRNKTHQTLLELSGNVTETDNCFYLRWPEKEKLAVNNLPLPIYRAKTGSNAFAANPMMPGTPGRLQGWQQSSDEDFDKFFTTNPGLVARGIGLQPEAFDEFHLSVTDWPYDRAWAKELIASEKASAALAQAGKDAEALAAYVDMAQNMAMSERVRADLLEKASLCAQRLKDYDKAMQLAKEIPVAPLSMHRQMQLMLEQERYDALLAAFTQKAMGGRNFHQSFIYPEQEDVMADLYYYRALAYIHAGNLEAAEADLKVMNDKRRQFRYRSGEAIHDLTWLRLGDFYRKHLKDDDKALEAYLNVCNRTTWAPWGTPDKPVLTGAGETLAKATEAVCDILRKQGKLDNVKELKSSLARAQADAAAALGKDK
jgi:tetratricopeptide (TPR) repeat protein